MNKLLLWVVMLLCGGLSYAQAPQGMSFQAVARDGQGNALSEKTVAIKVEVLQGSASGTVVYGETHRLVTAKNGVVNLQIGQGTVTGGTFAGIDWSRSPYFLRISMDTNGGTSYKEVATQQMLSVPYALYAERVGNCNDGTAHNFIVTGDGEDAYCLATGCELSYSSNFLGFELTVSYLDGEDQEVEFSVEGLPSEVILKDNSIKGKYGKFIDIDIEGVPKGEERTYSLTLKLKNKYGVEKVGKLNWITSGGDGVPDDSMSEETFWKTDEDVRASLTGVIGSYKEFKTMNTAIDNAFMGKSEDEQYAVFKNKTYVPTSVKISQLWEQAYAAIRQFNVLIEALSGNVSTGVTFEVKNNAIDQAKAIRAYTYLMLTEWFGAVPLVTKTLSMEEALTISRAPRSEVLSFVIQDLKDASIKTRSVSTKAEPVGITIDEMHLLLREAYLLKGEWKDAKTLGMQVEVNMLKSTAFVDFIKKIADWKLSNTEGITKTSLMKEYMENFHSTYGRGNLYLNILNYGATYFNMDAYKVLLPIPQNQIDLNSHMTQNDGYN